MKYDVHIYAVVRIKVSNVEAKDPMEAAKRAEASVNKDELFPKKTHASGLLTDNAEEIVGYHVDPLDAQGKPLADKSVSLNANCEPEDKTQHRRTGEQSKAPNVTHCWTHARQL